MKGKKHILPVAALALILSMGMVACGGGQGGDESKPAGGDTTQPAQEKISITATEGKTKLIFGEKVQLTASVDGVAWSSTKPEVATVDANGLVTSVGKGSTSIKASKEGYKDGSISISVDFETIKVTAAGETDLLVGESVQLSADKEGVTWTSSDNSVVTVDNTGKVTALKLGSATITASKDNFNSGSASINVVRPEPKAVLSLDQADHYSPSGEWAGYNTNYDTPVYAKEQASGGYCLAHFANGCKETFTFSSTKALQAEITLVILARSSYTDLANCFDAKFNENVLPPFTGIAYEGSADYPSFELSLGILNVLEGNNVLEINFLGDSPYLDDIKIYTNEDATFAVVPAAEKDPVVVNQESLAIKEGKTAQITSSMEGLSYKSNNTSIATVDENGLVTGVKVGETTISISKDGFKAIKLPVVVSEAEGVVAVSINEGTSEGDVVTFRTSQNLQAPYNYIVDAWPEGAELTIKANNEGAAGKYNMYIRARASGGYNSSTTDDLATCMEVKVNGNAISATGTVSGNSFTDYLLGEVDLIAGENTIVIKCLTTVPTINMLRFLPVA